MRLGGESAGRLLEDALQQPNNVSCGAASLVVAQAVRDEAFAQTLLAGAAPVAGHGAASTVAERFRTATLDMHRRVTGPIDIAGRLQLPWPPKLGTPPWAVAHQLSVAGVHYRSRLALTGLPLTEIRAALARGLPVPAYVGNVWSPRHVVLILGTTDAGGLEVYDPGPGRVVTVSADQLRQGSLPFGRWNRAWFVVLPGSPSAHVASLEQHP